MNRKKYFNLSLLIFVSYVLSCPIYARCSRPFRAPVPHMPCALCAPVPHVPLALRALVPHVLFLLVTFVRRTLGDLEPHVPRALSALVSHVLCALSAVVTSVLSCLVCPSCLLPCFLPVTISPFLLLFSNALRDLLSFVSSSWNNDIM